MPHKTLYVSAEDLTTLWAAAERVAARRKISVSRVVTEALETDLPRQDAAVPETPADRWAHIAAAVA
ncbi:hypothetical protein ACWKSP_26305 [Micromonosporaceae bacterium Da 78-11]